MKLITEEQLQTLLEKAYKKGWERAMESVDNVPTALIGWCARPEEFSANEVEELVNSV